MVFWWNSDLFACVYLFSSSNIDRDTLLFCFFIRSGKKRLRLWFEQNMKVDGFQRLIRQNVRGRSLFQKALLCFCISASLQAVKAIPTIGDFESLSGRRWERVKRRRSRKGCLLEARYIAQWNSGENLICLHVRTPSLALILREIAMPTNGETHTSGT